MNWKIWSDREYRERLIWQGLLVPERERREKGVKVLEIDDVGRAVAFVEIRAYSEELAKKYAAQHKGELMPAHEGPTLGYLADISRRILKGA